jgi:hypothetical protein
MDVTHRNRVQDAGIEPPRTGTSRGRGTALQARALFPIVSCEGWPIRLLLSDISVAVGGVPLGENQSVQGARSLKAAVPGPEMAKSYPGQGRSPATMVDPKTMVPNGTKTRLASYQCEGCANVQGDGLEESSRLPVMRPARTMTACWLGIGRRAG